MWSNTYPERGEAPIGFLPVPAGGGNGNVVIIISLLLWFLSSYGPTEKMKLVTEKYEQQILSNNSTSKMNEVQQKQMDREYNTEKLENSYAGIMGKKIEPLIAPLGFDWKIGIALITSFAAREVFVGTMATPC